MKLICSLRNISNARPFSATVFALKMHCKSCCMLSGYVKLIKDDKQKKGTLMKLIRFNTLLAMLTIFIAYLPFNLQAKDWQVNSDNSSIRYIYSLEGAAFRGRFREFSAEINFDSQKPEDGTIIGIVKMVSSKSSNAEHDEYLMEEDWFDPNNHPESRFVSEKIIRNKNGDNFIAYGNLTLAGISQPVEMEFDFRTENTKANFSGTFEIKRLLFGVGWDTTNWIADEVDVQIKLELN